MAMTSAGTLTPEAQAFAPASGVTQVTLACMPIIATLIVSVNGEEQTKDIDYTIAGMVITFLALDPLDTPGVLVHYWTLAP